MLHHPPRTAPSACTPLFCNKCFPGNVLLCACGKCGRNLLADTRNYIPYFHPEDDHNTLHPRNGVMWNPSRVKQVGEHSYAFIECDIPSLPENKGAKKMFKFHSGIEDELFDPRVKSQPTAVKFLKQRGWIGGERTQHRQDQDSLGETIELTQAFQDMGLFENISRGHPPSARIVRNFQNKVQTLEFTHTDEFFDMKIDVDNPSDAWKRVPIRANYKSMQTADGKSYAILRKEGFNSIYKKDAVYFAKNDDKTPITVDLQARERQDNPNFSYRSIFRNQHWRRIDAIADNWIRECMTIRITADSAMVGLFEMNIQDESDGPHRGKRCLYLNNVQVSKDFPNYKLSKYALWYTQQLALFINRFTLARYNFDPHLVKPIERVFLVTGKSNKGVENSAQKNSWASAEPDEDGYYQCNFWSPISDPGILRGLTHPPTTLIGNPFEGDVLMQPDGKLGEINMLNLPQSSTPAPSASKKRVRSEKSPTQEPMVKRSASRAKKADEKVFSPQSNEWNTDSIQKMDAIDEVNQKGMCTMS